ncbi:MAG: proline racemase family protein [Thermomicrobium sp.]|nr:proline racemase family protein [Thermomicrobium sp.]MCX7622320.1 proline racemase family protein [Thermomicrobium sp.]MDW8060159.1 proline racemase family protein [Thermomicrobium sp.]
MFGNARHVLHVWDYHHGQVTRIVVSGCPPLHGRTVREKQTDLATRYDHLRALVCREPRGHRNLLGAFLTEPERPTSHAGVIFVHPGGYFDACGDSTFSVAVALLESGLVPRATDDGEQELVLDTVLGPVPVRVRLRQGRVVAVTMSSGPSYALGEAVLETSELGRVPVTLAWGGLLYAFADATALGLELGPDLPPSAREHVLEVGTALWQAARERLRADVPGIATDRPVDLVTLVQELATDGTPLPPGADARPAGARVANFYAPRTMGRTPSGTGTAARVAALVAAGRLALGTSYFHESPVGLRFTARPVRREGSAVHSEISTMSYCMGIATLVLRDDDPFPTGFSL